MKMKSQPGESRRIFLKTGILSGASLILSGIAIRAADDKKKPEHEEEEIAPAEDLMREHGVLKRILLVYGECLRHLRVGQEFAPERLAEAASIIRHFIEDYHEKLEEDFLFPRFEKVGRLTDLTCVLREQHQAGRRLTDVTLQLATLASFRSNSERRRLSESLHQFIRMYEPHEAREDTVLFPVLRKIVTSHEFGALGEDFEKKEHQLFGEDGFEKMVDKVASIENQLGIYDLNQFTPV